MGKVLLVDDDRDNLALIRKWLAAQGYVLETAENGQAALEVAARWLPDLILMDVDMPVMNGLDACRRLKRDDRLKSIPVLFLTGSQDEDKVLLAFDAGAADYVGKPCDRRELLARVNSHMTVARLNRENEQLLRSMLPAGIAARLKSGETTVADRHEDVSVLFADIVGFTSLAAALPPVQVVSLLNDLFSSFDLLVERARLEKIKTVGDSYMVAGGLTPGQPDHLERSAALALRMCSILGERPGAGPPLQMRIGLHVGPAVAGVIGLSKPAYDIWGDTVNVASRLESHGVAGRVHVSAEVESRLRTSFAFESRGETEIKGRGNMQTFLMSRLRKD